MLCCVTYFCGYTTIVMMYLKGFVKFVLELLSKFSNPCYGETQIENIFS